MINDWIVHKGHSSYVSPFLKISLFFSYLSHFLFTYPLHALASLAAGLQGALKEQKTAMWEA